MKSRVFLFVILTFSLFSCMETRYMTEKYIKNNIEKHNEGEYSNIKLYTVFKGYTYGAGGAYLEFTGYKYNGSKGMVIGADKYYLARKKFQGDNTKIAEVTYIELTEDQCKKIMEKYMVIEDKIKNEKPVINEEIYHDYTVSDDLYISFRRASGSSSVAYIDFWVDGDKYRIQKLKIMKKLKKFIEY